MDRYAGIFQVFDKLAQRYQDRYMDLDLYNDTYDQFCQLLDKPNARVFEVGCGPGNISRYMLAKRPDFQIEGIDMAPNMIKLAKENNPTGHFFVMDAREIISLKAQYDGILCGFIMPYLSKEECAKLIQDCAGLLHEGGILYFSTMEGDYAQSGYETSSDGSHQVYMCYHEEAYLQEMLKTNHFELLSLSRKLFPKPDGSFATDMIFIARYRRLNPPVHS